jgi:hypothetical protein
MSDNNTDQPTAEDNNATTTANQDVVDMSDSTKLKYYHALGFRDMHRAKIVQHMDNDEEVFNIFKYNQ